MTDTPNLDGPPPAIAARSKRQAMEWSLVLASQDIAAIINRAGAGWELLVEAADDERARSTLSKYQIENRGWRGRGGWAVSGMIFHWGGLVWVAVMAALYYLSAVRYPALKSAGLVDSQAVARGQWWRLFTAISLHENLPHLLSNATAGFLLLGLAMARFGPGVAMLAAYLAGALGNVASVAMDPEIHYSLGASGMVTGALGLVTVQSFAPWRKGRFIVPLLPRAVAAGILIFVLIGFSPGTDMLAHAGGFVGGAGLGLALGWARPSRLQRPGPNAVCALILVALVVGTWLLACRGQ